MPGQKDQVRKRKDVAGKSSQQDISIMFKRQKNQASDTCNISTVNDLSADKSAACVVDGNTIEFQTHDVLLGGERQCFHICL